MIGKPLLRARPVAGTMIGLAVALFGASPAAMTADAPAVSPVTSPSDGQHDFDFEIGTWKARIRRLQHPLSGTTNWVEYDGSSIVRNVWNGRANLGELDISGPAGRIEGLSLRLYNPTTHQWAVSWANSKNGELTPPLFGQFRNGRGEFYNADTLDGKAIYTRFIFSSASQGTSAFTIEQAFSADGGNVWETNWIATFTKVTK